MSQNLLFALKSKNYSKLAALKLNNLVPKSAIDESDLSMRLELCSDKTNTLCKKALVLEYGYFATQARESFNVLLNQDKKVHRLSIGVYVKSEVEGKSSLKQNQVTQLMILVKQNNEIIYNSPINPQLHASLAQNTYIFNHPILSNFSLDIVSPNINKLFWSFREEKTIYGSDKVNSFCDSNEQFTDVHCEICFEERCLKCSDNAYLTKDGNCEPSKLYVQEDENGTESYSEGKN